MVCLELRDDLELINEIQRLNNAFGIGLIQLNKDDVSQSEILLPARPKNDLDWTTIDRLINENRDFEEFFREIIEDLKVGKVKSNYDRVLKATEMQRYILDKKISCE